MQIFSSPRRTGASLAVTVAALAGGVGLWAPDVAVAAGCPALQGAVTVDRGDSGPAVRAVQCALREQSDEFADLAVDGRFGSATETAVTTFQARRDLSADGVVGPATYRALGGRPVPDGGQPSVASGPVLRRGDTGAAVRVAQEAFAVTVDGVYGRQTEQAVAAFQGRQGLLVDGVLGPVTRRALVANGLDGF